MSQTNPTIGANKTGLTYRQEDNDGKKALLTHHKGPAAPEYAEAGAIWLNDAATPWLLRLHDGADWITLGAVHAGDNSFLPYLGASGLQLLPFATDTGAADSYALAPLPAASAYAAGQAVFLKPANSGTGAATLTLNDLGSKSIKMPDGADVPEGAILDSGIYMLVYDGTNFVLTNPSSGTGGGGAGSVIDSVTATYTANENLSTAIPYDDTLPQNTEGTEILSASITPKNSANKIRATFKGDAGGPGGGHLLAALFIGSGTDAACATVVRETSSGPAPLMMVHEFTAGTTDSISVKIRAGASSGTLRMNGTASQRYLGGAMACTLVLEEIQT